MHLDLKCRLRTRSAVTILARDASGVARERLVRAAVNAGLERSIVVDVAEALTGRPWACLGAGEISTVASELLSAADRVAHRPSRGADPCAS
jgi:hypothetical protein